MSYRVSVFDLPNLNDKHYGDRDLDLFLHTSPSMRAYRDRFIEVYGPRFAYDHLSIALYHAVREHFYEEYAEPFFKLREAMIELIGDAIMEANMASIMALISASDIFNEGVKKALIEVATDLAELPIPDDDLDDDHPITPLRRLYGLLAAEMGHVHVPYAPKVTDILYKRYSSPEVVPWFEPQYDLFMGDKRKEMRRVLNTYGLEKATEVLKALLPENWGLAPEWDVDELIQDVFREIVGVFFARCNDDAYMEAIVDKARVELDPYMDPRDQYYRELQEWIPDFTEERFAKCMEKRVEQIKEKYLIDWIEMGVSCGQPVDMTWIELCPEESGEAAQSKADA